MISQLAVRGAPGKPCRADEYVSMKPGFQRVRATSNRGFMSFRRLRDTPVVVLARSV